MRGHLPLRIGLRMKSPERSVRDAVKKIFPAFLAFLALLFCGLLFRSCTVRKIPFSDGSYIKADLLRHDAALHTKEGKRALGGITEWLDSEKYIYGEHKDGRRFSYFVFDKETETCAIYSDDDFYEAAGALGLRWNMSDTNSLSLYRQHGLAGMRGYSFGTVWPPEYQFENGKIAVRIARLGLTDAGTDALTLLADMRVENLTDNELPFDIRKIRLLVSGDAECAAELKSSQILAPLESLDGRTAYYDTVEWTMKSKSAPSLTGIGYDD